MPMASTKKAATTTTVRAERKAEAFGVRVIVAEEVKTASQGEVIGLFIREKIPRGLTLAETVAEIKRLFGLGMEKTVTPATACAGTTVTYRYEITSEAIVWPDHSSPPAGSSEALDGINVDFEDQLADDGRTFVPGSLVNPFGGDELPYGGTNRLVIENFDVHHGSTGTIEVDVALPADTPAGTLMNQARLTDLPGAFGFEVLSEFPGTPQLPDPTPLVVRQCADIGVDKSVDATVAGPGDELTYTVRATNHGPSDATGVDSVADTLPPGLIFVSAEAGGLLTADGTVRWPAMDLAVGQHRDLTVTARATTDVRQVTEDDAELDSALHVGVRLGF